MGKIKFPLPVVDVVPHKPPMSLLRHVLSHDADFTLCDVAIESGSLFLSGTRVDAWVGLEYMAQAVAAHAGMVARLSGKPVEIGFLLGTRRADFFTDGYRVGQILQVAVRHVWGEGELFSFDCSITDALVAGRCLATAQLNVFRPGNANLLALGEKR
jgi:predicted hotdog family 3-hydroxylacyl-ACP dehydratase